MSTDTWQGLILPLRCQSNSILSPESPAIKPIVTCRKAHFLKLVAIYRNKPIIILTMKYGSTNIALKQYIIRKYTKG